jgi:hypothetical protein
MVVIDVKTTVVARCSGRIATEGTDSGLSSEQAAVFRFGDAVAISELGLNRVFLLSFVQAILASLTSPVSPPVLMIETVDRLDDPAFLATFLGRINLGLAVDRGIPTLQIGASLAKTPAPINTPFLDAEFRERLDNVTLAARLLDGRDVGCLGLAVPATEPLTARLATSHPAKPSICGGGEIIERLDDLAYQATPGNGKMISRHERPLSGLLVFREVGRFTVARPSVIVGQSYCDVKMRLITPSRSVSFR